MKIDSLAFRLVAGAAFWCVAALLAGGIALSAAFRSSVEESFDARLAVLLESVVAASEHDESGSVALTRSLGEARFEEPYSGWYWQISNRAGMLVRSRSLFDEALELNTEPSGTPRALDLVGPEGQSLRVATRQIMFGEQSYQFTVAADRSEVEAQVSGFNDTLLWSFGILGAGLIAAVLIQVRFGLLPLRRIGTALGAIRRGREARLSGKFPQEIKPLADELNALLDQNVAVVERVRTQAGNLAHALKTPLSVLANESEASDGPLAQTVTNQVARMRSQVDGHLVRARTAAAARVIGVRSPVAPVVSDITRALTRIHAERNLRVATQCAEDIAFRGERQDLEEMVGNLMDNAHKWANGTVHVTAEVANERLRLVVEDDGAGLDPTEIETLAARGVRLDESVPGSGLGLAIVRDIAALYEGSLDLSRSSTLGGLAATLELPAAET
jgi:signal transduction histidine kinase